MHSIALSDDPSTQEHRNVESQPQDHHLDRRSAVINSSQRSQSILPEDPRTRKASWKEFREGFYSFLFKREPLDTTDSEQLNDAPESSDEVAGAAKSHWTDLAGTSASWFLLDFSFYFLGVNSWKIIANIWDMPDFSSVYQLVIQFSWRALVSVTVSSLIRLLEERCSFS